MEIIKELVETKRGYREHLYKKIRVFEEKYGTHNLWPPPADVLNRGFYAKIHDFKYSPEYFPVIGVIPELIDEIFLGYYQTLRVESSDFVEYNNRKDEPIVREGRVYYPADRFDHYPAEVFGKYIWGDVVYRKSASIVPKEIIEIIGYGQNKEEAQINLERIKKLFEEVC